MQAIKVYPHPIVLQYFFSKFFLLPFEKPVLARLQTRRIDILPRLSKGAERETKKEGQILCRRPGPRPFPRLGPPPCHPRNSR